MLKAWISRSASSSARSASSATRSPSAARPRTPYFDADATGGGTALAAAAKLALEIRGIAARTGDGASARWEAA